MHYVSGFFQTYFFTFFLYLILFYILFDVGGILSTRHDVKKSQLIFRFPSPLEHQDFEVDASYCTGGQWILPYISQMEIFVFSTKKLNLTLVHRDGDANISQAQVVLKDIQYIVENISALSENNVSIE